MALEKYTGVSLPTTKNIRCKYVVINNELNQTPEMVFFEEQVIKVDGVEPIKSDYGSVKETLTNDNINTSFPLVHPDTFQPIGGSMTYAELSVAIRSLYAYLANKRDTNS